MTKTIKELEKENTKLEKDYKRAKQSAENLKAEASKVKYYKDKFKEASAASSIILDSGIKVNQTGYMTLVAENEANVRALEIEKAKAVLEAGKKAVDKDAVVLTEGQKAVDKDVVVLIEGQKAVDKDAVVLIEGQKAVDKDAVVLIEGQSILEAGKKAVDVSAVILGADEKAVKADVVLAGQLDRNDALKLQVFNFMTTKANGVYPANAVEILKITMCVKDKISEDASVISDNVFDLDMFCEKSVIGQEYDPNSI